MYSNGGKVVIFGLGDYGQRILEELSKRRSVIAVDINERIISELEKKYKDKKNVKFIHGDASSILTWRKIDLSNVSSIISTVRDTEVALEICRIGREAFKLDRSVRIIVLLFDKEKEKDFEPFNVDIVNPLDLTTRAIVSLVEKNFSIALNIGLGEGELVETKVLANSHLVDRKLKHFKSTRWRISAIYRNGKFVLPTGETKIKIGDRVVIAGYPSVVENIVNIFIKGIPQFPLQFGRDIAVPLNPDNLKPLEEAEYLRRNSKAHKLQIYILKNASQDKIAKAVQFLDKNFYEIKGRIKDVKDLFKKKNEDIGIVVVPFINLPFYYQSVFAFMKGAFLKRVMKIANKPFLLSMGTFPYSEIVVSLNSPDPAFTLEIGMELSRISKIPLKVIYATTISEMRGLEEEKALKERKDIVNDFKHIYGTHIEFVILEGNPIKESVKYLNKLDKCLVIMSYDKKLGVSIFDSIFNPHIQYSIVKKLEQSALLIPLE
jgi:hypothetical protein